MKYLRRLPIVEYRGRRWCFDERLRQVRNVVDPYYYEDLDDVGMEYFRQRPRQRR